MERTFINNAKNSSTTSKGLSLSGGSSCISKESFIEFFIKDKLSYSNRYPPFGFVLKSIREEKGDSRKDLAKKLDVTPTFIYNIEIGKRNVPNKWIEKIVDLYNLSDIEKWHLEANADIGDEEVIIEIPSFNIEDNKIVSLAYEGKVCTLTHNEIKKNKRNVGKIKKRLG